LTDAFEGLGKRYGERSRQTRLEWHDDPVGFCRDCIVWPKKTELAEYQAEELLTVQRDRRLAVRAPHGTGKTTSEALLVLWFVVTREAAGLDWKAVTTAGAWRQLERYLWPEVHLWARRLRWDRLGMPAWSERNELLQLSINLRHGQAFAVASSDPALIEGAHAESLLYIFDESKAIDAGVFDAAEGAFAGPGEVFALACSTPGEPAGRFYDMHMRKPGLEDWSTLHITLERAITAGRIDRHWADQRARQWGEYSAVYQNRVLGEFASSEADSIMPLAWVEAAVERGRAWQDAGAELGPITHLGVDVAREGRDKTVLAPRYGDVIGPLRRFTHAPTTQTTGFVAQVLRANPDCRPIVDDIGVGGGVVDQLREQGFKKTFPFKGSSKSLRKDRTGELEFLNTRAAAWWHLREQLDPAYNPTLALPDDDELIGDLTAPHWEVTSTGKIKVEDKKDIKERIGRSPDAGDAVVQACFDASRGEGAVWMEWLQLMKEKRETSADLEREAKDARRQLDHLPRFHQFERGICTCKPGQARFQHEQLADGTAIDICARCGGTKRDTDAEAA
jgi:hypothetical protein